MYIGTSEKKNNCRIFFPITVSGVPIRFPPVSNHVTHPTLCFIQMLFIISIFSPQVNNDIHVNSVDVPDSDLMATNGVIHVVKNVLYPAGEKCMQFFSTIYYICPCVIL